MHDGCPGFDFEGATYEQSKFEGSGADLLFSGAMDPGPFDESAWPFQQDIVAPYQSTTTPSVDAGATQPTFQESSRRQGLVARRQNQASDDFRHTALGTNTQ